MSLFAKFCKLFDGWYVEIEYTKHGSSELFRKKIWGVHGSHAQDKVQEWVDKQTNLVDWRIVKD